MVLLARETVHVKSSKRQAQHPKIKNSDRVEEKHAHAGYFIHTRKTARNLLHIYRSSNISLVSGSKLIKLLEGIMAVDKLF